MPTEELSPAAPIAWTEAAFKRFWQRMGEIFGKSWYDQHGPEPSQTWRASLTHISVARIAKVLESYRTSGDAFPPNLSQVMARAREIGNREMPTALPPPGNKTDEGVSIGLESLSAARKRTRLKTVFLPGESFTDYQSAMQKSGKSQVEFDAERLRMNGYNA